MHASIPIIGIAGGIGSGKSFVAGELERLGAAVIDADQIGHQVLDLPDVRAAARERWGAGIFEPSTPGQQRDEKIDRKRLAKIVFEPSDRGAKELAFLEQLTHPRIREQVDTRVAELSRQPGIRGIVVDAPLLIEAGWNDFCDKIVYVGASREARLKRALARGWSQEDFDRREMRQESLQVKSELADVVIDNSGSSESTRAQVGRVWHSLIGPTRSAD